MLATHPYPVKFPSFASCLAGVLLLGGLCGCGDPGPRALLKGEHFLKEGRYQKALDQLKTAVRLLPNTAQAWNHLGLAHHHLNQPQEAFKAYSNALLLDSKLAAARFNLGCLLLEQGNAKAAMEDLTSFTMLHPGSVEGWLKLGLAQRQAGLAEAAERSYRVVLDLEPGHPVALNGLGLVQKERRRPLDALQCFNQAATKTPIYAPALYNAGVVAQTDLKNRRLALEKYQQYLELQPRPKNWEAVSVLARGLELALDPMPAGLTSKTNPLTLTSNSRSAPASPSSALPPPLPPTPAELADARAKALQSSTSSKPLPGEPSDTARPAAVAPPPAKESKPSPPPVAQTTPEKGTAKSTPPPKIEAQKAEPNRPTPAPREPSRSASVPAPAASPTPSPTPKQVPTAPAPERSKPAAAPAPSAPSSSPKPSQARAAATPMTMAKVQALPGVPRYNYRHPAAPLPGDREKAEAELNEGLKWHRAGRQAVAIQHYQAAAKLDPSYFHAYYNQGLAAYQTADWQHSLYSYEVALALEPDNVVAQYNFCLALSQANYPVDAAQELLKLLQNHPNHDGAHLTLANLYAQVFKDYKKARLHYSKVLEIKPRHPEAARIRYWLTSNP